MKKKVFLVMALVLLITSVIACSSKESRATTVHKSKDGKVGFLADGYTEIEHKAFDIRCKSDEGVIGLMLYNMKDFRDGYTKMDVLDFQVNDLMSKRENPVLKSDLKKIEHNGKVIYQKIYLAEKGNNKFMYIFNLVDFGEEKDEVAYVIITSRVSYGERHMDDFNEIVKTTELFN